MRRDAGRADRTAPGAPAGRRDRDDIVSPGTGPLQEVRHALKAETFDVDLPLDQANPDDFDAAQLPGGALNADARRSTRRAQGFVRWIDATNRPIVVICHGAWLLASAGLVNGRNLTRYPTIQDDLRNAQAHWLDLEVVRDRNWVSSRQPGGLPAFNRAILTPFAGHRAPRRPARAA